MPSKLGKYILKRTLGQGSFSKVKLGVNQETGERVAVKIHKDDHNFDEKKEEVIIKEINTIIGLSHPYIINMLEYEEEGVVESSSRPCYKVKLVVVQELAEGGELFFFVKNTGPFKEQFARYMFHQIIEGLEYMHSKGVAHRDIKPDNILLDQNFNIKIADFGFAGPIAGKCGDGYMTTTLGTKPYEAPEIIAQQKYKGEAVDLFASAVVLFIMVSGIPPFGCASEKDYYYKLIANQNWEKFWGFHTKDKGDQLFSPEFMDLMQLMLAFNPLERLNMKELKSHPWYTGPIPTDDQVYHEFQYRKKMNDEMLKREQAARRANQPRQKYRGMEKEGDDADEVEEEKGEPFELKKKIKKYEESELQTKMFYYENPDTLVELIQAFIDKKSEVEEVKLEFDPEQYKAKVQFNGEEEQSVKLELGLKLLRVGDEDQFCLEVTKLTGDLIDYLNTFEEMRTYIDTQLGYVQESQE